MVHGVNSIRFQNGVYIWVEVSIWISCWNNVRFQRWNNVIYFNIETTSYFNVDRFNKSNVFSPLKFDVVSTLFHLAIACWVCTNMKRDLELLRCIHHPKSDFKSTTWTICAFRAPNPHQSLAEQNSFESWKVMPKSCRNKVKQKGRCNKPTKLQFQSILTQKILMLSNAMYQPKSTV